MDAEPNSADLWRLSDRLDESSLSFAVFKLDSLDAALVVQIPRVLVVGDRFREACFNHEIPRLFVQVLLEIGANDDVHCSGLTYLVLVEATVLVCLKDERADLSQDSKLFVRDRDKVDSFGCK